MQTNSAKPLGYYCSDVRDSDIMNAIALEFGDRLEQLTELEQSEALAVLSVAHLNRFVNLSTALLTRDCFVKLPSLPRNFLLLADQLTTDGRLALSIVLINTLRNRNS
ncbi:hypothetical protein ACQ4M3_08920 [Leptolyngbya sp. AN03gr2]|uniref:hypothetical protein n=1 Tax=unclassified Leptolyngbya TaxID=2650499 RepID=UPI003D31BFA5